MEKLRIIQSDAQITIASDPGAKDIAHMHTASGQDAEKYAAEIISAYNATYGNSINPESVKDMHDALQEFVEWAEKQAMWDKTGSAYYMAIESLKKAKL